MNAERTFLLKQKIGVLWGGPSSERDISLKSGVCVLASLKKQGFKAFGIDVGRDFFRKIKGFDMAFIAMHGKPGEDGTVQAVLEFMQIPYTGSGVAASAIGMDKILSKGIFIAGGIPTPPHYHDPESDPDRIIEYLGLPVVVKPRAEGSSVGVAIVKTRRQLAQDIAKTGRRFPDLFFERFIPGMTATCGILHDVPLPILEMVPKKYAFYDYKSKYTHGLTDYIIPARLPEPVYKKVQACALAAHRAIGAEGFSRVDFVVDGDGRPFVLEVNTIPGLLAESNLPLEARAIGLNYDELIYEILTTALPRSSLGRVKKTR